MIDYVSQDVKVSEKSGSASSAWYLNTLLLWKTTLFSGFGGFGLYRSPMFCKKPGAQVVEAIMEQTRLGYSLVWSH